MKIIVSLLVIFAAISLRANAQDCIGTTKQDMKILKLMNSLPEVVSENQFRKKAHYKMLLKAYIQNKPTKENDYYRISISEDLGFQLRTYDWYEVNPRTYHINYFDSATGKVISLREWRKQLHTRQINRLKLNS